MAVRDGPRTTYAVSVLDDVESRIAPADAIELAGQTVRARAVSKRLTDVELWPLLAVLALALVCVEWVVYNSRARL